MVDTELPDPPVWVTDSEGWTVVNPAWRTLKQHQAANGSREPRTWPDGRGRSSVSFQARASLIEVAEREQKDLHERFLVEQTVRGVVQALATALPALTLDALPPRRVLPDPTMAQCPASTHDPAQGPCCDSSGATSPPKSWCRLFRTHRPRAAAWLRRFSAVLRRWAIRLDARVQLENRL